MASVRQTIGATLIHSNIDQAAKAMARMAASDSVLNSIAGTRAAVDMHQAVLPSGVDIKRINDILAQVLEPTTLTIANWSAKRLSSWTNREQRLEAAVRAHGWWVPPSWSRSTLLNLGETAETSGKVAFRRAMATWHSQGRCWVLRNMLNSWMTSASLDAERRSSSMGCPTTGTSGIA